MDQHYTLVTATRQTSPLLASEQPSDPKLSNGAATGLNGSAAAATNTPRLSDDGDKLASYLNEAELQAVEGSATVSIYEPVVAPYAYLDSVPGKNTRDKFIDALNVWLKVSPNLLDTIKRVTHVLHTASLLIDDIEDNSALRRGQPSAHVVFGVPRTINAANLMYFQALKLTQTLPSRKSSSVFMEELLHLHYGQGMDLYWRELALCPTESQYMDMVANKTGGLFRLAVKLMLAESNNHPDLPGIISLVDTIGVAFQVRDDYLNLSSGAYADQKGAWEDITEGKLSFPVIHCIRNELSNGLLLDILKQRTTDMFLKQKAVEHMISTGSLEYTKAMIKALVEHAKKLVGKIPGQTNQAVVSLLDALEICVLV